MKRKILIILLIFIVQTISKEVKVYAAENFADSLSTIDTEFRKYFPRWRICEPDLQFQIYKAFEMLGYPKEQLNMQKVEVLASPKSDKDKTFEILLIQCGDAAMSTRVMDNEIRQIVKVLSGQSPFRKETIADKSAKKEKNRDYCYIDIPPEVPISKTDAFTIQDYYQPSNKRQAIALSLFEQDLKIGSSNFNLKSKLGTDDIGYPFWYSGDAKITIQRPLYKNTDDATNGYIENLVDAYLGAGYRITSGLANSGAFNWMPDRVLNNSPGGKLTAGFDIRMPFMPQIGMHISADVPMSTINNTSVDKRDYGLYYTPSVFIDKRDNNSIIGTAPVLQTVGKFTVFYNWWTNEVNPENYFRFDLGIAYYEIQEYLLYDSTAGKIGQFKIDKNGTQGLNLYKPNSFGDWIYLKIEYRNQATYPFGLSMQYSNQILLARAYYPLLGNWLLLEAKYSTPLRPALPFEIRNYFVVSPVLRITI